MKMNRFEDLEVWKLARLLVKDVYILANNGTFKKDYSLVSQIQRSAVSIMANIAEGFERKSKREFIQFLYIAKGSSGELRSHLYIAFDLNYINQEQFAEINNKIEKISKSLSGFIKYLSALI